MIYTFRLSSTDQSGSYGYPQRRISTIYDAASQFLLHVFEGFSV